MATRLRSILAGLLALALVFAPGPAWAQLSYYFWWDAVDERAQPYTGQNVQCSVWRPNIHGAAVLHSGASLAGYSASRDPLWSDATGKLHFWSSSSEPVDINCWYTYGGSGFSGRMRTTDHRIVLPRQGTQIVRFAVNNAAATYQTDSGVTLPQGAVVRDVVIQNLNPQGLGQYHLTVGFLGNHAIATADALVAAQALSSPDEWLRPHRVLRGGGDSLRGTLLGNHRGTALSDYHQTLCLGGVCGATAAGISRYWEVPYLIHVSTGLTVSYSAQPGSGAGLRAHVYILYDRLHSPANVVPFGAGR